MRILLEIQTKGSKSRIKPIVNIDYQGSDDKTFKEAKLKWINDYVKRSGSNRIFYKLVEAQKFAKVEIINAKKLG